MTPAKAQLEAAIYDRVSKDRRMDSRSVAEQKAANITACSQHGWRVVDEHIFTDNDRSASRFARKGRPAWELLCDRLAEGDFGVIVMWEPSRGDRELEMWARLLNTCRRRGVLVHITSHSHTYDVSRPRDWRTLAEDGVDSAYESEKVSERIRRGTRARAAEGRPHGRRLYGYDRIYDQRTGELKSQVINDDEARVLRDMAEMLIDGSNAYAIAAELNQRGIPGARGGVWGHSQVRQMLLNPTYMGYRTHHGERIHSPEWFPPIFDEHSFYLCRSLLVDPSRKGRPTAIKHLLSGLAVCGVCGRLVRSVKNSRNDDRAYACVRVVPDGKSAFHASRGEKPVDLYVESLVIALAQRPEALTAISGAPETERLKDILDEAKAERARLEEFYSKAAVGLLSAEGLAKVEAVALPKIEAAERRASATQFTPHLRHLVEAGPEEVPARWARLDILQKRDIISGYFEKVELMPVGRGGGRYAPIKASIRVTPRQASGVSG